MSNTPVDSAKAKVAEVFRVLAFRQDTRWVELVRGGFECEASLVSSQMRGFVGYGGEYQVEILWGGYEEDGNHRNSKILLSGSFRAVNQTSAMSCDTAMPMESKKATARD